MEHRVQRQRKAQFLDPGCDLEFAVEGPKARDPVGTSGSDVLNGQLNGVEPSLSKTGQPIARERDTAGDQARIEIEVPGLRDQLFQIVADERLATREVETHHPQLFGFGDDALPGGRVELVTMTSVVERIRAVDAAQGASVGQLRDQRIGAVLGPREPACTGRIGPGGAHRFAHDASATSPRSAIERRNPCTSRATTSRGCVTYLATSWSTISSTV